MAAMGLPTALRNLTAAANDDEYKVRSRCLLGEGARSDHHAALLLCVMCVQVWSADPSSLAENLALQNKGSTSTLAAAAVSSTSSGGGEAPLQPAQVEGSDRPTTSCRGDGGQEAPVLT